MPDCTVEPPLPPGALTSALSIRALRGHDSGVCRCPPRPAALGAALPAAGALGPTCVVHRSLCSEHDLARSAAEHNPV
ncbi:unnamed protein product [Caretta caretta]